MTRCHKVIWRGNIFSELKLLTTFAVCEGASRCPSSCSQCPSTEMSLSTRLVQSLNLSCHIHIYC